MDKPPFESHTVMLSKTMFDISMSVLLPNLIACDLERMVTLWTYLRICDVI